MGMVKFNGKYLMLFLAVVAATVLLASVHIWPIPPHIPTDPMPPPHPPLRKIMKDISSLRFPTVPSNSHAPLHDTPSRSSYGAKDIQSPRSASPRNTHVPPSGVPSGTVDGAEEILSSRVLTLRSTNVARPSDDGPVYACCVPYIESFCPCLLPSPGPPGPPQVDEDIQLP